MIIGRFYDFFPANMIPVKSMINYFKIALYGGITLIIVGMITTIIILGVKLKNANEEISYANVNLKASFAETDSLKNQTRAYQFTVDQLEYFNDSLLDKLKATQAELNIKNKHLQQMHLIIDKVSKTDTIVFKDTIFCKDLHLDTLLQDNYYKLALQLDYPNYIKSNVSFNNERKIIVSVKKETIKPPKKCAFLRWFQKKHKVVIVEVVDNNPYVEIKQQRFIEVIK